MPSADATGSGPFTYKLRVRYAEVDVQGIVFNAHYLTYFDVAVTEYFRAVALPYADFVSQFGVDFHVSRAEIDYKAPAHVDDEIAIELAGEYSGATLHWNFRMLRGDSVLCAGKINYVCVDKATGKVRRISAEIGDALRWAAL